VENPGKRNLRVRNTIEGTPGDQPDAMGTTIEVNTSGVKITSSVIALIILALSIVFFFLY
jgi:hypothetical protein